MLNGVVIGDLDIGEFWGVDLKYDVSIKLVAREKLIRGTISYTTVSFLRDSGHLPATSSNNIHAIISCLDDGLHS